MSQSDRADKRTPAVSPSKHLHSCSSFLMHTAEQKDVRITGRIFFHFMTEGYSLAYTSDIQPKLSLKTPPSLPEVRIAPRVKGRSVENSHERNPLSRIGEKSDGLASPRFPLCESLIKSQTCSASAREAGQECSPLVFVNVGLLLTNRLSGFFLIRR